MLIAFRRCQGGEEPLRRIPVFPDTSTKKLHDFVTTSSMKFFHILELNTEFLNFNPSQWSELESYKDNIEIVKSVRVVNDVFERAVSFIQDFNESLTRDEEQKVSFTDFGSSPKQLSCASKICGSQ